MDVSIVIPTYNEAENVEPLIKEIAQQLEGRNFEIIFVDDDSPDGTADIIEDMQDERDFLRLIRREQKAGIGSAYKEGFREAKGNYVVQMDADFSHRPEDLPKLIETLEQDVMVVIGSRYVDGGERKDPVYRRIFPIIGSYLYRFGLGASVKDFTSGFKGLNAEVVEDISEGLPDGFCFNPALLLSATKMDYEIVEVPIKFEERRAGKPKYSTFDLCRNALFFSKRMLERH
jgi:dolichol-phosphate mannosyltransferase